MVLVFIVHFAVRALKVVMETHLQYQVRCNQIFVIGVPRRSVGGGRKCIRDIFARCEKDDKMRSKAFIGNCIALHEDVSHARGF